MNRNNVIVTRKERRRDRRRAMQIEAILDGHPVMLADLSASGFGVAIDATDRAFRGFRVGKRTHLELRAKGAEVLTLMVEIVREEGENGVVGGAFIELSDEDYNTLESLLTGRFRRRR